MSDDFTEQDQQELETVDLGNPASVKKTRDKHARDLGEEEYFWRSALKLPVGRRALYRLLVDAHAFDTRFAATPAGSSGGGFPDPNATWFYAGQQDFGQYLFYKWMKLDFESVNLMLQENDARFAKPKPKRNAIP